MRSRTTARFRDALSRLPPSVQEQARRAYARFQQDPSHNSLQFKEVAGRLGLWSARISRDHRALARRYGDEVVWIWAGSHADYEKLIG